ncbi:MAG: ammonium transporter [Gemmatimonas sp.]|jgi:Amt family ammonium transporter|uniref:ammonium transporter n=1 Tax=Gemmatimonas sp. TaxID=1962908 RepID=UPI0025B8535C|nr:ammonium transporter [Gemmatimonas sp.]MCA2983773.1 ammonium transporter [Gemmatimonas sp.]MCA2986303.1 ammonium transporter [Gemmatimonas sp.]MCA2995986.1 ammonium transporter [Gemmatimonas sp.]MCE2953633.1 ammonium transporter [Gemmatimonas sp.]
MSSPSMLLPFLAAAQADSPTVSAGDTAWVLISTALVLLMVPGLAFFYGGLVRTKSALNTMLMSLGALGVVTVQWVLFGYSLAFGPGSSWIGGFEWLGFAGVTSAPNPTYSALLPHLLFAAFQAMFAGITVALFSGAVIDRMRFVAYLAFGVIWTTIIYDPLAHWVWGDGGWLRKLGALDFAGGTVVHISAGTTAVVLALFLGPRRDFKRLPNVPHNVPFALLGAGLLWFGWFGFNAGSALAADGIAANALVTTHTAAASGMIAWLALELFKGGRATAVGAATGAVVGLVTITPAAGFVTPLSALLMGALAAPFSFAALHYRPKTRLDDTLDVFACHGVAGIMGAVLTGVFASKAVNPAGADGLLHGNPSLIGVQLLAVVATIAFAAVASVIILYALQAVMSLRVPVEVEVQGIDLAEHGEEAYHGGDLSDLTGRKTSLSDAVVLPATELGRVPRVA